MDLNIKFIFILLTISKVVNSANILFLSPTPSYSHSVVYFPIIRELSLRGHKVVSIIPDLIEDPKLINLTEIDIHDEAYKVAEQVMVGLDGLLNDWSFDPYEWYHDFSYKIIDGYFQFPEVQELIQHPEKYHFDLVITEWITYQSVIAFADLFKCPLIGISSYTIFLHGHDAIGNPTHPIYQPNAWDQFRDPSSLLDRVLSVYTTIKARLYYNHFVLPKQNYLVQKNFGKLVNRSIEEMEHDVSLVLTNTNPILHGAYPKVANLIEFGGIHMQKFVPLEKELQLFLEDAENGFIYFSLGSNIKSFHLGDNIINTIINVFKKLPYKVIWKLELRNLTEKMLFANQKNIYVSKWLPQRAILEHPKIKLFIMQGGLQSTEEALRGPNRVPLIIIPFLSDQNINAGRFEQLGLGKRLLRSEITEEHLEKTIHEVINNTRYKECIAEIANTLWDQPTKPLDRVIWWIEYVIRHKGAKYLRNPALNATWSEANLLDVYLFIFSILVFGIVILYLITKRLIAFSKSKISLRSKKKV
ncbi:UDP-glycosyltransferase UGT4-like [Chrysoperla carnea]|uniref:UDP-glycosyltransferase UGT4-like n=1 Tax=Chrysoperla carnea TaxID=189513 RepID=UPI001D084096|nr:UDP-glycosyltransferase UGT4-like [Chrysoperla carnea]